MTTAGTGRDTGAKRFRRFATGVDDGSDMTSPPGIFRLTRAPLSPMVTALLMAAITLLLRTQTFGNPALHVDEQFYLLAGDRMLHGAIPYVDIWDRKPIGLFLIYAATALPGGGEVLQYQLAAALSVACTAWLITRISTRIASDMSAILAGIAYIAWLNLAGGDGGQAAVFYNLPVAIAALLLVRMAEAPAPSASRLRWNGAAAMLLAGCAIQIKYNAVFESIFFGLTLLRTLACSKKGLGSILAHGLFWIVCALLPTAAAISAYAMMGHLQEFIFANFLSIGERGAAPAGAVAIRFLILAAILSPLLIGVMTARTLRLRPVPEAAKFVLSWLATAGGAVIIFGTYFVSYCLPVLVPATVAASASLDRGRTARRTGVAVLLLAVIAGQVVLGATRHAKGDRAGIEAMAQMIRRQPGCLFVYDGHPILYYLSRSCLLSRFVFPGHLNQKTEENAVGVNVVEETRRILAHRPGTIATVYPAWSEGNPDTARIVNAALRRDYRLIYSVRTGKRVRLLYALRPAAQ
jgi:hypothetical protein